MSFSDSFLSSLISNLDALSVHSILFVPCSMRVLQALLAYSAYFSEISFDYTGNVLSPPRRDWRYLICKKVNIN